MALFKLMYLTVCTTLVVSSSIDDNTMTSLGEHSDPIQEFIEWAQQIDLGQYSEPFQMKSTSFRTLTEYQREFYKDLECSFAFSALVHMHLTRPILEKSVYLHDLFKWDKVGFFFTDDVGNILSIVYNNNDDNFYDGLKGLAEVMWPLLLYAEWVKKLFMSPSENQRLDNECVLKSHDVIVVLLEEFIKSRSCQAVDPDTSEQVTDVRDTVGLKFALDKDTQSLLALSRKNKNRLGEQNIKNYTFDHRFDYMDADYYWHTLLINRLMDNGCDRIEKLHDFGIRLDLNPIALQLGRYYELGKTINTPLHVRIESIAKFHKIFMHLLMATFVRIVIVYLMHLKQMEVTARQHLMTAHYNGELVEHLKMFEEHCNLTDDPHWRPVKSLITRPCDVFSVGTFFDDFVAELQELLKDISFDGMRFDEPLTIEQNKGQLTEGNVTERYDLPQGLAENHSNAEKFVMYVKYDLAFFIDFKAMKSFAQLENSTIFNRLKQLEENQ